jgi:excisionase family DNA binding protein
MTVVGNAQKIEERLPSAGERAAANQLRKVLAGQFRSEESQALQVSNAAGQTAQIVLTPAMSDLLIDVLRHIGKGDAVTLVPVSQLLTTQQAADLLNVSRPHLVSLLEGGEIGHVMVGRHRRVRAEDLFAFKAQRDRARTGALQTLADLDADLI